MDRQIRKIEGTKLFTERAINLEHDDNERTIRFIASDETVDRYGDVVSVKGWQLANYKKNPIFLWGHDYAAPIGRVTKIGVEDNKLMATAKFAAEGASEFIDSLWKLVRENILRSVSVGFTVESGDDYEAIRDADNRVTGTHFLRQELLEISLVSVPANPSALLVARGLGLSPEFMKRTLHADALVQEEHRSFRRRLDALRLAGLNAHAPRSAL